MTASCHEREFSSCLILDDLGADDGDLNSLCKMNVAGLLLDLSVYR